MTYQEFCTIAESANRQGAGKTLITKGCTLNQGMIYRPTVNQGRGVLTNPTETLKIVWRYVKKSGQFSLEGQTHLV